MLTEYQIYQLTSILLHLIVMIIMSLFLTVGTIKLGDILRTNVNVPLIGLFAFYMIVFIVMTVTGVTL